MGISQSTSRSVLFFPTYVCTIPKQRLALASLKIIPKQRLTGANYLTHLVFVPFPLMHCLAIVVHRSCQKPVWNEDSFDSTKNCDSFDST